MYNMQAFINVHDYCMTVMKALVYESDKLITPIPIAAADTLQNAASSSKLLLHVTLTICML